MSRIVYVNGEFVPEADAKVSVFDRGFIAKGSDKSDHFDKPPMC